MSVASNGTQANGSSYFPSISEDGRYVVFHSSASNLAVNPPLGGVYVHDRQTGQTTRVSVASDGSQSNGSSGNASISADGRYVAFQSTASNLVPDDTNSDSDIFVHDRQTGQTTRVSVASNNAQANSYSETPSISGDGRYVAFISGANNLVPNDTNNLSDTFVHDRQTGQTIRVSVSTNDAQANEDSSDPSISGDGQHVVFWSYASNLVPDDTNDAQDVFVHNWQTGKTVRISVAANGAQANGGSLLPSISDDGQHVVFFSAATNLVSGDSNGISDVFVALNLLAIPVIDLTEKSTLNYFTTATPTLTWNSISWAVEYQIEIDTNPRFTTVGRYMSLVNGLSHPVETPLTEGVWYWRVRAKGNNGIWGSWSAAERFKIDL